MVLTAGCAYLTPPRPKVRFAFWNAEALLHVKGETGADALRGGASDMCEAPPARTVQLSSVRSKISLAFSSLVSVQYLAHPECSTLRRTADTLEIRHGVGVSVEDFASFPYAPNLFVLRRMMSDLCGRHRLFSETCLSRLGEMTNLRL